VDTGFRKRSCPNNKLKRDDDSKKSHHALDRQAAFIATAGTCPAASAARRAPRHALTEKHKLSGANK
jgi:hypothetical protein